MKRFFTRSFMRAFGRASSRATTAVAVCALLWQPAAAAWHTDEIGWHISRTLGAQLGGGIGQIDTTLTVLNGASVLDTSAIFSLDKADVQPRGQYLGVASQTAGGGQSSVSDTTAVGFLVAQTDSGSTPAVANGTFIVLIDGKIGGYGGATTNALGWARVDSINVTLGAVADQSVSFPIKTIGKYGSPMSYSTLRARTVGGTGTMGSVRLFLRWWSNNASNPRFQP